MSIRTVRFKKKVAQAKRTGKTEFFQLLPSGRVKSDGRTTVFGQVDSLDEDGNPQKAGKRYPGRASDKVVTERMKDSKMSLYARLSK